ncbi:unnamed protein product [Rotaria sp. Silwood1]|nr:unnamed protein product [Rotaria sp. Silwood1]CAF1237502.1 unnamed protein product [Rotaria sp. Silwood1]CAF3504087.1 unnamed protein product [Rotaria sp. Silwood1]CAF3533317.1 unnamed protein product [Rotaria sp. Silwood1]CAF4533817.1 unnamed protein product [Rotaria sp. Silwood1]
MQFFYCLIFLSCIFAKNSFAINNNNYILCTSHCTQITLSFSQPLAFPTECQNDSNITNIYDHALACTIEYRINYYDEKIYVKFQITSNDTNMLEDHKPSEFLTQEIWLDLREHHSKSNQITGRYGCNSKNDCARDFYLNTINHLVSGGKTILDKIKGKLYKDSLLLGPKSKRQCSFGDLKSNSTRIHCPYGLCYVRQENYTLNQERNSKEQKCDNEIKPILFSFIEYHEPKSIEKEKKFLEYRCNKNVCNRNGIIPKIQQLIDEYTQWHPTIKETIHIDEKKASSSMQTTISSYIIVIFLILIQLFI